MSQSVAVARRPTRRQFNRWSLGLVGLAAVLATVCLILIGQSEPLRDRAATNVPTNGKTRGNPGATVTIDEWADFQCPGCRQFALGPERQLDSVLAEGQARFVWHNRAFLGQESIWAAEAAECANDQGQFWPYHDKLFAEQSGENRGAFRQENLKRFGRDLGLDSVSFDSCVDSNRYEQQVKAEAATGAQQGINSTPTILMNGQRVDPGSTIPQFRQLIEMAAAGTPLPPVR
jgi:protein-disulfide isomerase